MSSLPQIQEVPPKSMILLVGPPGSGKSTFCQQVALQSLAMDRPIVFVTTEYGPSDAERALRERGLGEVEPGFLNFVDAYNETVGGSVPDRPDTVYADCNDLSSIDIAISKLKDRIGKKGILLVFDSLTSPYLFSGSEILRFTRQTLSRLAFRGNAVLACIDEGCGKEEDLVAMMSLSNGVIKIETEEGRRLLNVVKHPRMEPTKIEVRVTVRPRVISSYYDTEFIRREAKVALRGIRVTLRPGVGDYVNIAWRNLIFWSGMLGDPKRFPTMMYDLTKYSEDPSNYDIDVWSFFPWHKRILLKLFMPKSLSKVKDMRKIIEGAGKQSFKYQCEQWKTSTVEYLDGVSKTDEHYLRLSEHYECWGFEKVGASLGIMKPAMMAGGFQGMEELAGGLERNWNAIETKCIGLGDPYCEAKLVPGQIDELKASLEAIDNTIMERIHNRLMDGLMGFILRGEPLWKKRPRLGNEISLHGLGHIMVLPAIASERYGMAMRLGGAMGGKRVGEHLMNAGMAEDEAVKRILSLFEYCKVGKVTIGETLRMIQNCERFMVKAEEPSCHFTTGFLNGLFSAVKNQHVKETRCIAMGDPYCEWKFR